LQRGQRCVKSTHEGYWGGTKKKEASKEKPLAIRKESTEKNIEKSQQKNNGKRRGHVRKAAVKS